MGDTAPKTVYKKRGRKPRGGRIVGIEDIGKNAETAPTNIILHLRCKNNDRTTDPETFDNKVEPYTTPNIHYVPLKITENGGKTYESSEEVDMNVINRKLLELTSRVTSDSITKNSACFYCTCTFDTPSIYIPKNEINGTYQCYGCFCSPECATGFLMGEPIDNSEKFDRYSLLCNIYCKIYNYKRNITPAPNPFYTLDKYYGTLTIQQYRELLTHERVLLVVDRPLTRCVPEIYDTSNQSVSNMAIRSTYEIRPRKEKKSKNDILQSNFNLI
jgi:hypothetical protein